MTDVIEAPPMEATPGLRLTAADQAKIDAYLGAGERAAVLFDAVWKVCAGLMVLTAVTWVLGLLPGAVRLF